MPEAAGAALRRREILHDLELHLHDRDHHELRDALARADRERLRAAIPAGHHELSLVVRIDEPDEVAEHDAVLVTQTRARQDHRGKPGIVEVDREAGRNELGTACGERQRRIEAGAQVEAGRAAGRVLRQRELPPQAWVEDAHSEGAACGRRRAQASAVPRLRAAPRAASSCAISPMSPRARASLSARGSSWRAPRLNTMSWLSSQSNALSCPTSLAAIMSRFLRSSLARALLSTASVSAAKPTTNGRSARAATVASTSVVRCMASSSVSALFLIFCSAARAGR